MFKALLPMIAAAQSRKSCPREATGAGQPTKRVRISDFGLLSSFVIRPSSFALLAAALLLPPASRAQDTLSSLLFTAGTTTTDASARHWAYLYWSSSADVLRDRSVAIYAKSGEPDSPSDYERVSIVRRQADPITIASQLSRSAYLGEDLAKLEQDVDNLFKDVLPSGVLSLAEKLSAVIRGAAVEERTYANLVLLTRVHPGAAMAVGLGYAQLIPGPLGTKTTFEIRDYDEANSEDRQVIGRVTVSAGQPLVLPAPGPLVQVPDAKPTGNLNAKFRWATSDTFRRVSLMGYGFNLWQMRTNVAVAGGFHLVPPTPATLAAMYATGGVHRVNDVPIIESKDFTPANVGDFTVATGDPDTFFYTDDNRFFEPGRTAFTNGESFYYFTTGRDLLARDGLVSPGILVVMCDRLPPQAPTRPRVFNDYQFDGGTGVQKLRLEWEQNTETHETITGYYVYRYNDLTQFHALAGDPAVNRIAGPIPPVPGQKKLSYVDAGAGSPSLPNDADKTFWYTVRAMDSGACGGNLSAHSAPAWGVLRDRTGPGAGTGTLGILCFRPTVLHQPPPTFDAPGGLPPNLTTYRLLCQRATTRIIWAEFYTNSPTVENLIGRFHFPPGTHEVSVQFAKPPGQSQNFYCRVGTDYGQVSDFEPVERVANESTSVRMTVRFNANINSRRTIAGGPCNFHLPKIPPGFPGSGGVQGIELDLVFPPATKEIKVYRRVDDGPLTLFHQMTYTNFLTATEAQAMDDSMPSTPCTICYFFQTFDEHGNSGPMTKLDPCVTIAAELPTPMLAGLVADGDESSPRMVVNWFCPPHGVDRFHVFIASEPKLVEPDLQGFAAADALPIFMNVEVNGTNKFMSFTATKTPRVGPGFGSGATFATTNHIVLGRTYYVLVKAVDTAGNEGPVSNLGTFRWNPPQPPGGPNVPWPARGLPPTTEFFHSNVVARQLLSNVPDFQGVGIRIGHVTNQMVISELFLPAQYVGFTTPTNFLYVGDNGTTLLPLVVYRYQVENANYPIVSGDVVQVTPLMEEIAYGNIANGTGVYDPFVFVFRTSGTGATGTFTPGEMYLLDTQPLVVGARYRYLIVRLADNKEIEQVIVTNEVEIQ